MRHVSDPLESIEDANDALPWLSAWPQGQARDDRLIEIFIFKVACLWRQFPASPDGRLTTPCIVRSPGEHLIEDEQYHRLCQIFGRDSGAPGCVLGAFYQHATPLNLVGSIEEAERFKHVMAERFECRDGTPRYGDRPWHRPHLSRIPQRMFDHFMDPGHKQRRQAVYLDRATDSVERTLPRQRL